jgi:catechol-2,3-dioxygenase
MAEPGPRDPEELDAAEAITDPRSAAGTTVGPVHLTVAEPDPALDCSTRAVGLEVLERHGHTFGRGGPRPLVRDPSGNALLLAVA